MPIPCPRPDPAYALTLMGQIDPLSGVVGAVIPVLLILVKLFFAGRKEDKQILRDDKQLMWERIFKLEGRIETLEKERDKLIAERDTFLQHLAAKDLRIQELQHDLEQVCVTCPWARAGKPALDGIFQDGRPLDGMFSGGGRPAKLRDAGTQEKK